MELNEEDFENAIDAADVWPPSTNRSAFAIINGRPCDEEWHSFNAHEQNPDDVLL